MSAIYAKATIKTLKWFLNWCHESDDYGWDRPKRFERLFKVRPVPDSGGEAVAAAARVCECDIDDLLVDELTTSPEFVRWLMCDVATATSDPSWADPGAAVTSVSPHVYEPGVGAGETDIRVDLALAAGGASGGGGRRRRLLIEDKIAAAFTPDQPGRYKVRARAAVERGDCDRCVTVLVAPERYMATPGTEAFDLRIPFERIAAHFRAREAAAAADPATSARCRQRRERVECAIEAARAGYVLEVDEVNTDFWRAYRSYMAEHFPSLRSKASPERGRWALDVYFEPLAGLKGWNIKHSLQNDRVVVELLGWGQFLPDVREAVGTLLDPDVHLGHAAKSRTPGTTIHLWLDVPHVSTRVPFEQQVDAVRAGLDAAARLQGWCRRHSTVLAGLSRRIRTLRASGRAAAR
jgi:hypothetical protein